MNVNSSERPDTILMQRKKAVRIAAGFCIFQPMQDDRRS
jgi:hypothetical protein